MFEDNQADLEQAVEALSELLEKPIEKDGIAVLRQQVTDKTVRLSPLARSFLRSLVADDETVSFQVYVQKRHDILLDDSLKGYLENRCAALPRL